MQPKGLVAFPSGGGADARRDAGRGEPAVKSFFPSMVEGRVQLCERFLVPASFIRMAFSAFAFGMGRRLLPLTVLATGLVLLTGCADTRTDSETNFLLSVSLRSGETMRPDVFVNVTEDDVMVHPLIWRLIQDLRSGSKTDVDQRLNETELAQAHKGINEFRDQSPSGTWNRYPDMVQIRIGSDHRIFRVQVVGMG